MKSEKSETLETLMYSDGMGENRKIYDALVEKGHRVRHMLSGSSTPRILHGKLGWSGHRAIIETFRLHDLVFPLKLPVT